jgi:hypothetical protein
LETNKERLSKAGDALSRVEANVEYLREKISSAVDEEWRQRYEGWLLDSEDKRKNIRSHMQRVSEWIDADERRLAKLYRQYRSPLENSDVTS